MKRIQLISIAIGFIIFYLVIGQELLFPIYANAMSKMPITQFIRLFSILFPPIVLCLLVFMKNPKNVLIYFLLPVLLALFVHLYVMNLSPHRMPEPRGIIGFASFLLLPYFFYFVWVLTVLSYAISYGLSTFLIDKKSARH